MAEKTNDGNLLAYNLSVPGCLLKTIGSVENAMSVTHSLQSDNHTRVSAYAQRIRDD